MYNKYCLVGVVSLKYIFNMKRIQALEKIQKEGINNPLLPDLLAELVSEEMTVVDSEDWLAKKRVFTSKLRSKFKNHRRTYSRLIEKEKDWLDGELYVLKGELSVGPGRPSKHWNECSERSKRRKVARYKFSIYK